MRIRPAPAAHPAGAATCAWLGAAAGAALAARAAVPGLGWAVAIAFGAAVAPTDPVSATSIMERLGAPPRIVTILEGESLINDGVALTAFSLAVEALAHPYSIGHGVARLAEVVAGGVAYGLAVGFVIGRIRRRIRDPSSQIVVSLLIPSEGIGRGCR